MIAGALTHLIHGRRPLGTIRKRRVSTLRVQKGRREEGYVDIGKVGSDEVGVWAYGDRVVAVSIGGYQTG